MKNIIKFALLSLVSILLGLGLMNVAQGTIVYPPCKYGTQVTIYFGLYDSNSPWRNYETAPAAADVHVFQDGASEARATNSVTDLGRTFSLVLTATEMQAKIVVVDINDASNPPLFGDEQIIIPTFGHANALNPTYDANVAVWKGTTVPSPHTAGYPIVTVKDGTGTGEIDTASGLVALAANSITASVIATNALTANGLATSFIDEIEDDTLTNNKTKQSWAWWSQRSGGGDPLQFQGTAQAGGSTNTIILQAGQVLANNACIPSTITLLSGTGAPATRTGVSFVAATNTYTIVGTWPGATPTTGTIYLIQASPASYFASEGLAQSAGSNTLVAASGTITADNLLGLLQIISGPGSGTQVYNVTDSYDANDTLVINGTWAGATPTSASYYVFTPSGGLASDATAPTPGLTITDIQAALTNQGLTSTRAAYLDWIGDPNGATLAADLATLEAMVDSLEGRLTATRAEYLDLLVNGTYGLDALHTDVGTIGTTILDANDLQSILDAVKRGPWFGRR